jgi:hypothetical protein
MTMYSFLIQDSDADLPDDEGHDCPDLAEARRLAFELLGQLIIDDGAKDRAGLKVVNLRGAMARSCAGGRSRLGALTGVDEKEPSPLSRG